MKLYIEKWTTETVHIGRLFSVDTATLREEYPELQGLSDDEIAQHIRDNSYEYDFVNEAEAIEARNSSADYAEDDQKFESALTEWRQRSDGANLCQRSD